MFHSYVSLLEGIRLNFTAVLKGHQEWTNPKHNQLSTSQRRIVQIENTSVNHITHLVYWFTVHQMT
jgi:hypothetical protein